MGVLLAVIDDLFQFARTSLFGVFVFEPVVTGRSSIASNTGTTLYRPTEHTSSADLPFLSTFPAGTQYFIGEPHTALYVDPVVAFDTAMETLNYGELVYVQKLGGRWAQIRVGEREGWVLKDVLRESAKDVFPTFAVGMRYDADNTDTKKLRLCIDDEFCAEATDEILFDAEYVTYKLRRKGKHIVWGTTRPRIAGTWQQKLRGSKSVHSGIAPKNESVMEYVTDTVGHLGYVEAVFPDESIKVSYIGVSSEGVYDEVMLHKDQWKELRPVFIEVL